MPKRILYIRRTKRKDGGNTIDADNNILMENRKIYICNKLHNCVK